MKKYLVLLLYTLPVSAEFLSIDEMKAHYEFADKNKLFSHKKAHPFYKLAKYFSDLITKGKRESSTDEAKIITVDEARNLSDTLVKMFAEGYGWWGGFSKTESIKEDSELCAISALETLSAMATKKQRELFKQTLSDKEYLSGHYAVVDSFMTVGKLYNHSHERSIPLEKTYELVKKVAPDYLSFTESKDFRFFSLCYEQWEKLFNLNKYRPFYAGQSYRFFNDQYGAAGIIPRIDNLSQMEEITHFALRLIPWNKDGMSLDSHKKIINILFPIKEEGQIKRLWSLLDEKGLITTNTDHAIEVVRLFAKTIPHEKWDHFADNAQKLLAVLGSQSTTVFHYVYLLQTLAEIPADQWGSVVDESLRLLNTKMTIEDQARIVKALSLLADGERHARVDAIRASLDATNADYGERVLEALA